MQRLVYAPKVNAWVKTDTGVVDLSPFIVRGSVSRRVDQVSSAEITVRNPKLNGRMVFTEHLRTDTKTIEPLLHPMDPIIITLTRLHDRPIQVFTGYCDSTPYLQLYPGTVTVRASCTLKRLMHTYWDPGLQFTRDFLQNYGWFPNQAAGGISNPTTDPGKELSTVDNFNDGSIGNLLLAVLRDVGGWDDSTIYIEPLPEKIGPLVANLYVQFQEGAKETKAVQEQFQSLLTNLIGSTAFGSGGPSGGLGDPNSKDFGNTQVPRTVYCVGVSMGVPSKYLLAAMATGLVEAPEGSGSFGNPGHGSGTSLGWRQETSSSYPNANRLDVRAAAARFYRECKQHDSGQSAGSLAAAVQRPRADLAGKYSAVIASGAAQRLLDYCKKKGCSK